MSRQRRDQVYDADVARYREALARRRDIDAELAVVRTRAGELTREAAAEGVHPGVVALGRRIEQIKDLGRRREFIREAAKLLIEARMS